MQNRFSGKYISRFQNWSLVLRIEIEHSHKPNFLFGIDALFPNCYFNLKSNFCIQNWSFVSGTKASFSETEVPILETNLPNWVVITCWKWSFELEFLASWEGSFNSKKEDSILWARFQFWKINFNSGNEGYIYLRNKWPY